MVWYDFCIVTHAWEEDDAHFFQKIDCELFVWVFEMNGFSIIAILHFWSMVQEWISDEF